MYKLFDITNTVLSTQDINEALWSLDEDNTFDENLIAMSELEYKLYAAKTFPFEGNPKRLENIQINLEKSLKNVLPLLKEPLENTFRTWLDQHALTDARKWAEQRLDIDGIGSWDYTQAVGEQAALDMVLGEYSRYKFGRIGRSQFPLFSKFLDDIEDQSDNFPSLENVKDLLNDDQKNVWYDELSDMGYEEFGEMVGEEFQSNDEAERWIDDSEGYTSISDFDLDEESFINLLNQTGVAFDEFLIDANQYIVFPLWYDYWRQRGIDETRELVEEGYQMLLDAETLEQNIVAINHAIDVNHQNGPMLDHMETYSGLDDFDYHMVKNAMDSVASGEFVSDWNDELKEVGISVPTNESIESAFGRIDNVVIRERLLEITHAGLVQKQADITNLFPTFKSRVKSVGDKGGIRLIDTDKDLWNMKIHSGTDDNKWYEFKVEWIDLPKHIADAVADKSTWKKDKSDIDYRKIARKLLKEENVRVLCTCPAFQYWGPAYILSKPKYDGKYGRKETRPPVVRNPNEYGAVCKHGQAFLTTLPFYATDMIQFLKDFWLDDIKKAKEPVDKEQDKVDDKTDKLKDKLDKEETKKVDDTEVEKTDDTKDVEEAVTSKAKDILTAYGLSIEDSVEVEGYDLVLTKELNKADTDDEYMYQVAIQKDGLDFTDIDQQFSKQSNFNTINVSNFINVLSDTLNKWVNEYDTLYIASMNIDRNPKYANVLRYLGFEPKSKTIYGITTYYLDAPSRKFSQSDVEEACESMTNESKATARKRFVDTGKIDKEALDYYADFDPTEGNKYLEWIIINKDNLPESKTAVKEILGTFYNLHKRGKADRDIDSFKSFDELDNYAKNLVKSINEGSYEILWKNDEWMLVDILNQTAAEYWGHGSEWCISHKGGSYYDKYMKEDGYKFFILINAEDEEKSLALAVLPDTGSYEDGDYIVFEWDDTERSMEFIDQDLRNEFEKYLYNNTSVYDIKSQAILNEISNHGDLITRDDGTVVFRGSIYFDDEIAYLWADGGSIPYIDEVEESFYMSESFINTVDDYSHYIPKIIGQDFDIPATATDLGDLEEVGGDVDFSYSQLLNLGELKIIGGDANFEYSQIDSFDDLKEIGGRADFSGTDITEFPEGLSVGKSIYVSDTQITNFKNFPETIDGVLDITQCNIDSFEDMPKNVRELNWRGVKVKDDDFKYFPKAKTYYPELPEHAKQLINGMGERQILTSMMSYLMD